MEKLLNVRELILEQYLKWERYLVPFGKFLAAFVVMLSIHSKIGYNTQLKSWFIAAGISLIAAFLPMMFLTVIAAVISIGHIFSASLVLAGTVSAVFVVLYLLLLRFVPQYAWAAAAIPVLSLYKLQLIVPIVLGLTSTPLSILAVAAGVIAYHILGLAKELIEVSDFAENEYMSLYQSIVGQMLENKEMMYSIIIFSLVVLVVFLIRIQKIDYGFELSIGAGTFVGLLGFLITGLASGKMLSVIFGSIISGVLVLGIWFLFLALDYTKAEDLQFQDDDYYYYVRAVPKIKIEKKKKNIKRMNVKNRK